MFTKSIERKHAFGNFLLVIILLEVFLMGSGRLLEFRFFTVRMVLFAIAIIYSAMMLGYIQKMDKQIVFLLSFFVGIHLLGLVIGFANGADMALILTDLKPVSYFFMIVFFAIVINSTKSMNIVITILKTSSLVMAFSLLMLLLLLNIGLIDYQDFFYWTSTDISAEFATKEYGLFYNGFLYLCVGFVFYFVDNKNKINKLFAALLFTAIVFTFTRGFLLSVFSIVFIYLGFFSKRNIAAVFYFSAFCIMGLTVFWIYSNWLGAASILGMERSNEVRLINIQEVIEAITPASLLIGHGLGIGTTIRPEHMEISYLEIFHKQGILGLLFWIAIFVVIVQNYLSACKVSNKEIALPFMLSSLLIFIQTSTNPYMNNPIGMSFLLITISVLKVLAKRSLHNDSAIDKEVRI